MMAVAVLPLLCLSALFDVRAIPLADPAAPVLLAPADADRITDVFVLDGNRLTAYPTASQHPPYTVVLAEGASGFDIADIDNDGFSEVIAVCGDNIRSYRLAPGGIAPATRTLFTLSTQLAAPSPQPYPYVMVVRRKDETLGTQSLLLALPCENTFELRSLDGAVAATFPIGADAPRRISYGSPFAVTSVVSPRVGSAGSLEAEVSRVIAYEPELPPDLLPSGTQLRLYRRGTLQQARDAAALGAEARPWFPLKTDGAAAKRAIYALADPGYRDSLVWIRDSKSEDVDLSGRNVVVGPQRRYPGAIYVDGEDLPDFNGDGYVDLVLWQAPEPATSIDSLTRVLLGQQWPIQLSMHLFSPQKNRFEPRPAGQVSLKIPVEWFMRMTASGPLRHVVLRDFDGDGRTDIGCAVGDNQWSAWLFGEQGATPAAEFTATFDEPIESVEFRANLDTNVRTSIGLRTRSSLHLLHPAKDSR